MDYQPGADLATGTVGASERPVVVIGAGVAGLAAARRLAHHGRPVLVLEREQRIGGRIFTDQQDGFAIDGGAEFIAGFYGRTLALIREGGLRGDLRPIPMRSAILRGGQGYRVWAAPQSAFSPLLALNQKLRLAGAAADLVRYGRLLDIGAFHRAAPLAQRSVAEYASSRLSAEWLEWVIQPALGGIFYWTPERTSAAMLLLLLKAAASHPAGLQLLTLRRGMGQIAATLAAGLPVHCGVEVARVEPCPEGGYCLTVEDHGRRRQIVAAGVVCATTASVVPELFPELSGERRAFFSAVSYSMNLSLMLGLARRLPATIYSLLIPRRESAWLASATVQGVKNPAQLPPGHDLLALHMNGPASRELIDAPDELIAARVLNEWQRIAPLYDPGPAPLLQRIYRWREALPEFDDAHFARLRRFAEGAIEWGEVVFAGDYLGGPFVEGAIRSGEAAAARLIGHMGRGRRV